MYPGIRIFLILATQTVFLLSTWVCFFFFFQSPFVNRYSLFVLKFKYHISITIFWKLLKYCLIHYGQLITLEIACKAFLFRKALLLAKLVRKKPFMFLS